VSIPDDMKCLRCQGEMELSRHVSLVTGSHSAGAKLLFGQLAELDERPWPLDAYRCANCGHIELFDRSE